jgi:hypothetical protein
LFVGSSVNEATCRRNRKAFVLSPVVYAVSRIGERTAHPSPRVRMRTFVTLALPVPRGALALRAVPPDERQSIALSE